MPSLRGTAPAKPQAPQQFNIAPTQLPKPQAPQRFNVGTAVKPAASTPAYDGSNGSGGGYSGGSSPTPSGGGGGGGGFAAPSAPAPPPPPVMEDITIPDAQADTGYQKTVADLARTAVDFKANQGLARSQYDTQYNEGKRRMGWDETAGRFDRARPGSYHDAVDANEGDFAGRGSYWSGAMGNAFGDINRDFGDRKSSLDTARKDNVDTQNMALSGFTGQQDAVKQAALQDVISKLAAQYAIGLDQVPVGSSKTIQRQVV